MIIEVLEVKNYRNLDGLKITNSEKVKFIFGENGIGKSNILELLNIIFNKNSFQPTDFCDKETPIDIKITLSLSGIEQGYFDDLFDIDDHQKVTISATQERQNGRIEFCHSTTRTPISYQKFRAISFVYYNSVQAPDELNFNKSKTAGKFLNSLVDTYIQQNETRSSDLINMERLSSITAYVNNVIHKVNFIDKNDVSAKPEDNVLSLIPKLIELKNSQNISVNDMGSGVRYSSYIYFEILNKILLTIKNNQDSILIDTSGKKHLPIIIALDEPEIHLHPYMQRNLLSDINKIITNSDNSFCELIRDTFGIDSLIGQLIVSTHSPNILSDSFKGYVRLYRNDSKIYSKSGSEIHLVPDDEKHLLLHAPFIKEAFFARSIMIFEGVSEYGSVPLFAEKIGVNLDVHGIGIISADGADTIPKLKMLAELFAIPTVCVVDKDKVLEKPAIFAGMLHTNNIDFESDLVDLAISNRSILELLRVIQNYENDGLDRIIQIGAWEKVNRKLGITIPDRRDYSIKQALQTKNYDVIKLMLITWLSKEKNAVRGRLLGQKISTNNIPQVYINAINTAKGLAENV